MDVPRTRYARVGEGEVAYQVLGDGPVDLLFSYGVGVHVEIVWDIPVWRAFLERLASFSRLVLFDRRGTGASDRISFTTIPSWEESIEDMTAVLDAVGSSRAAVLATLDTGPNAILLAAMRPDRVSDLVLFNTFARFLVADDYPIGASQEAYTAMVELTATQWGTEEFVSLVNPTTPADQGFARAVARMSRIANTPHTAAAQLRYLGQRDVRSALASIQASTLVVHVRDNPLMPVDLGQYLADHIAGATFVALPGGDLSTTPSTLVVADEVAEFLTGERPAVEIDRVLTTVLFTDIVGSTERAASMGDRMWRSVLDAHDRTVRDVLRRFRGREVTTTGDGFVASFDGPARAIRCAHALVQAVAELGIALRIGLHTGECEVRGDDLGGLAVHIAARVASLAQPDEVLVSGTTKDLVIGAGIDFRERGDHELKGVPGSWKLFAVAD